MNVFRRRLPAVFIVAVFGLATSLTPARAVDSAHVKKLFKNPPREFSTGPLWVWNDLLTDEQIRSTLRDLASQKIKQVWVHPRPGLMTPYLSAEWFHLWKVALDEAKRLDMNVWIYDENSYPSGFAGGWVPELMPESRGRGLALRETKTPPKWEDNLLAVHRLDGDTFENVTARVKAGEPLPEARYVVASVQRSGNSPWNANRCYVDLLYPGVTEKFLEVTLEAYRKHFGGEFGKHIPGSFTDEPELRPAGGMPWTADLPEQFKKRWGYDLIENLPGLKLEIGDWKKVRHNYYQTLLDLFIARWGKPYFDYCAKHNLEFTGHYWEHEWPGCGAVPDNMAMAAWQQRPGIDILMNQYAENTHAQFGNVRGCREISSIANQFGRRTLVEVYGAGGWDLRFEDMKRIGDWLEVLGVNTLNQHLSYITLRGARKRDHPQSFSYHEPWWEAYHVSAGYLARLTAALTQGEQINRVLVLEPTTTAWMYQGSAKLNELGDSFFKLLMKFEAAQIEYDLGCEDVMSQHGSVENQELKIGHRRYHTLVISAGTENLNARTWELTRQFVDVGGKVLACGIATPLRRDGAQLTGNNAAADMNPHWQNLDVGALSQTLATQPAESGLVITRARDDKGILFHHRREVEDGQLVFLVNTSIEAPSSGTIESDSQGVEQWNLHTGATARYAFEIAGKGIRARFALPPSGSLLLFLSKKPLPSAPQISETTAVLRHEGEVAIRRLEPNVLTLDYVNITAGGETKSDTYFYAAGQFAFQKNGMERNPWDSAVQFKDEIISKKFPANSGFSATYKFTIESVVPKNLAIVIERPDLYTITCNGQPVAAEGTRRTSNLRAQSPPPRVGGYNPEFKNWWLDKAFGKIPIAPAARTGENVVTIQAWPFTIYHELEPAYVLGDFALKPAGQGFVIAPNHTLQPGGWNKQGHPFYSAGVAYLERFKVGKLDGKYFVSLPKWLGSVAKVSVNGKFAGYIDAPPWECDVTKEIKRGDNDIEVTVIGTLKNTLGPHHGNPPLGAAWPSAFHVGPNPGPPPGEAYSTVGYGLFEPFVLKQIAVGATRSARK